MFNEEKKSVRRTARCHLTLEKSSKNYISLFQESPPEGYPRHPPPPLRKLPPRIFHVVDGNVRFAGAVFTRGIHSREERGEGGLICETMSFDNESSD
jgi:hypothetical protein